MKPDVYVITKGNGHKQYEYGNKVSTASTKDNNIIVGVVSHVENMHDSNVQEVLGAKIILPKKPLKKDNRYQRDKKRKLCKRRAAIEPIIGHLIPFIKSNDTKKYG